MCVKLVGRLPLFWPSTGPMQVQPKGLAWLLVRLWIDWGDHVWSPCFLVVWSLRGSVTVFKMPAIVLGEHRLVLSFAQINVQCSFSEFFVATSLFKVYHDYVQKICNFSMSPAFPRRTVLMFSSSSRCKAIFLPSPPNLRFSRASFVTRSRIS